VGDLATDDISDDVSDEHWSKFQKAVGGVKCVFNCWKKFSLSLDLARFEKLGFLSPMQRSAEETWSVFELPNRLYNVCHPVAVNLSKVLRGQSLEPGAQCCWTRFLANERGFGKVEGAFIKI